MSIVAPGSVVRVSVASRSDSRYVGAHPVASVRRGSLVAKLREHRDGPSEKRGQWGKGNRRLIGWGRCIVERW